MTQYPPPRRKLQFLTDASSSGTETSHSDIDDLRIYKIRCIHCAQNFVTREKYKKHLFTSRHLSSKVLLFSRRN